MTKPRGVLVSRAPLTEASLSRLYSHWMDKGFAVVSAFRGEYDRAKNMVAHGKLKQAVRAAGYGFIPLVGYWVETHAETGEEKKVEELSLLIPNKRTDESLLAELRKHALAWGRISKPVQESIIFVEPGGPVRFLDPKTGSEQFKLNTFRPGAVGDIYSRLTKRPGSFIFEKWTWASPPRSMVEAHRRRHEGELVFIAEAVRGESSLRFDPFRRKGGGFFYATIDPDWRPRSQVHVTDSREAAQEYVTHAHKMGFIYELQLPSSVRLADEDAIRDAAPDDSPYTYPWELLEEHASTIQNLTREGFDGAKYRDLTPDNRTAHMTILLWEPASRRIRIVDKQQIKLDEG